MKNIKIFLLLIIFLTPCNKVFSQIEVSAEYVIIQDHLSGKILYEKNSDAKIYPASMTKIMTTIVAFDLINSGEASLDEKIIISEDHEDQKNPYVYWSGHSFLISWEDGRNSTNSSPEQDIYFQEVKNGSVLISSGGVSPSSFDQKQERPIIAKYSDTYNYYIILWEDYRSTGKEFCANLYGQSYYSPPCTNVGDTNCDALFNVLDVVILAQCVINANCQESVCSCAADVNSDGTYNVLDIVTLINTILN